MSEVVGATHQFHDAEYAEDWSQRFTPTPERLHLFETILQQLQSAIPADGHVVELGIGPAYLAEYLLARLPSISYEGVDFSQPMLGQAASRLDRFAARPAAETGRPAARPVELRPIASARGYRVHLGASRPGGTGADGPGLSGLRNAHCRAAGCC